MCQGSSGSELVPLSWCLAPLFSLSCFAGLFWFAPLLRVSTRFARGWVVGSAILCFWGFLVGFGFSCFFSCLFFRFLFEAETWLVVVFGVDSILGVVLGVFLWVPLPQN